MRGLIARGASGWCPVTAAIDSDAFGDADSTRRHLAGSRGVIVEDAITIYRPVSEVYSYWRNLENLPRFMEHLEEVRVTGRFHSHWVARGPLGVLVEWDAEIINDIPPTLISWKSVGHSDVVSAGSVRFKPEGEHATQVHVKLQYDPPAGKLGATVAWFSARIRSIRSPRICDVSSSCSRQESSRRTAIARRTRASGCDGASMRLKR